MNKYLIARLHDKSKSKIDARVRIVRLEESLSDYESSSSTDVDSNGLSS